MRGRIFDIQRFSTGDGPGIRTTIFCKGCPLSCAWCHNPESQVYAPELRYRGQSCIGCGRCAAVCRQAVHSFITTVQHRIDRKQCVVCGDCARACPTGALRIAGEDMEVDAIVKQALRDKPYYGDNGGVTLSGGEPTMQPAFALELLRKLKQAHLHTALDTCGYCKWSDLEPLLPYTDLVLYDLKHMDSEMHSRMTGVDNSLILTNFQRIQARETPIWVRVPLIPDYNDSEENARALGVFLKPYPQVKVDILPYHGYGEPKYQEIGRTYHMKNNTVPTDEAVNRFAAAVEKQRNAQS